MNKIVFLLLCMILVTSFLADIYPGKILATEIFFYGDDSSIVSYLDSLDCNDDWISYNDGYADNAFGLIEGGVISMAIELTDVELAPYRNYVIDKLNVAFGSENNPPGEIVDYKVWIKNYLPSDPYCSCVSKVATGISTGDVWNTIDVADTAIPDTGNLFIGINIEYLSGQYPCGVDLNQSGPTRAALMTYQGYGSWTDLFAYGFPGVWCIDVSIYPNNPPNTPTYLNPSNHETNVDVNDNLLWTCSDPEGDNLTYDVYFGTSSNPPLVLRDRTLTYYDPPGSMKYNTKYYWKIVVEDEFGESVTGPIWDFTTVNDPNNPPYIPSNPDPENGSNNISLDIVLIWIGGDPDAGDIVTYDVYFGSMFPLQKIASNISNMTINPGILVNGLTYFWSVVAWDNHGVSTIGPGWYFTTININNPPNKPSIYGENKGKHEIEYLYTFVSTDPEGDEISYYIDWGDNSSTGWTRTLPSGECYNSSHSWSKKGDYTIKAKAQDVNGAESDWSTLEVSISKNKATEYTMLSWFFEKLIQRFPFFEKILNKIL